MKYMKYREICGHFPPAAPITPGRSERTAMWLGSGGPAITNLLYSAV